MLRRFGSQSIHGDPLGLAVLLVCGIERCRVKKIQFL